MDLCLPLFRGDNPYHSHVSLSVTEKTSIASALNKSLSMAVTEEHINSKAQLFLGCVFVNDLRRTTSAFDRNAVRSGKSVNSCFIPLPHKTVVPNAVVVTIISFYRVSLGPSAPAGLKPCYELVLADVHSTLAPQPFRGASFGYCAFDNRHAARVFVESSAVGPPVGVVRSPRLGHPNYVQWIINTHWTNKLRHHLDN